MRDFAGVTKKQKEGNMKKANPRNIVLGLLGLCTIVSIGGAVSSSLAWYAYASRADLKYSGTSVFDNGQLQIGVRSEIQISSLVNLGMTEELRNNSYYYFAPAGEGLDSELLNEYLNARGYASNELSPVTSGEYDPDPLNGHNQFSLLSAPNSEARIPDRIHNAASKTTYSKITFAFRTFYTNASGERVFVGNQEIWLTYAQAKASVTSYGSVSKSMRLYVERDSSYYGASKSFIYNPSSKTDGETKVGGMLNLGYDGYYDFDENGEIVYGEYSVDPYDTGIIETNYSGDDIVIDMNDTGSTEPSTFTAKHSPESPAYYPNLSKYTFKTAKYKGSETTLQAKDVNGLLFNPEDPNTHEIIKTSVCKTGDENSGYIGEFDATIYLEGWDFSVVDEEQHHRFDFQLRFETNRVQE